MGAGLGNTNFMVPNCPFFIVVPNCPFYMTVPNCPGAKLSVFTLRCQIVRFSLRCQIVRGAKLSVVPNCPRIEWDPLGPPQGIQVPQNGCWEYILGYFFA